MPRMHVPSQRDEAMADLILMSAARDDDLDDAVAAFSSTYGEPVAEVEEEVRIGAAPWHEMQAFEEHVQMVD